MFHVIHFLSLYDQPFVRISAEMSVWNTAFIHCITEQLNIIKQKFLKLFYLGY
jgi:hypothetical protein